MAKKLHSMIRSRETAMAAMEPALKRLIKRAQVEANCADGMPFQLHKFAFGAAGMRVDVQRLKGGSVFLALYSDGDFFVARFDEGDHPEFPDDPSYCGGRVRVSCWERGAWEAEFGAGSIVEPFQQDVMPLRLTKFLRSPWHSPISKKTHAAKRLVDELQEWVGSEVRADIERSLARDLVAESHAVAAVIQIPGPRFAMAYVLTLGLSFAGAEIVKAAFETALTKCPDGLSEGVAIIEELLGSHDDAARFLVFYEIGGKSYEGSAWATL